MQWKTPKNTDKYYWTAHVAEKMHYYGLSEQKVLGVIRKPKRTETGIAKDTVAVMLPVGAIKKGKAKPKWGRPSFGDFQSEQESTEEEKESWNQEIWVMYQAKPESEIKNLKLKKLTIISAWRYPGMSPKNNPIPEEIWRELGEGSNQ
ncbi:MAG: hypothetical protein WCJ51_02320 [Candidatus Moraniibacteriota bacterium]